MWKKHIVLGLISAADLEFLNLPGVGCHRHRQYPEVWSLVPMESPKGSVMEGFSVIYI